MAADESSERDKRIGAFILNMLDNSTVRFTTDDWIDTYHVTKAVCTSDLRRAVNLGLLRKENPHGQETHRIYVIPSGPLEEVRCSDLTKAQREILTKLYFQYRKREFTVHNGAKAFGRSESAFAFHLTSFVERGIMTVHDHPEYPGHAQGFRLAVSPKEYPQCFILKPIHEPASVVGEYTTVPVPMAAANA